MSIHQPAADRYAVYVYEGLADSEPVRLPQGYTMSIWRPTRSQPSAPGSDRLRVWMWSAYHFLRVFRSREFGAVLIRSGNEVVNRTVVFPAYYAFPYMRAGDVQIGHVTTSEMHRGKGLAKLAVREILRHWSRAQRRIFYVADERNASSIAVVQPLGFTFFGWARHEAPLLGPRALGHYRLTAT